MKLQLLVAIASAFIFSNLALAENYAIVVSITTQSDSEWSQVVNALLDKHQGAKVITWSERI